MPVSKPVFTPSIIALIVANLFPLIGVFFWEWNAFMIILLYWVENLVIGGYNLLKMILLPADHPSHHLGKIIPIPFFCIHYGGFCAGHGFFLLTFFGEANNLDAALQGANWPGPLVFLELLFAVIMALWEQHPEGMGWLVLGLIISHGISFVQHYWLKQEYRTLSFGDLMSQPYGRIVILHIAIIFGGMFVMTLGSPTPLLCILILLKIGLDLKLHSKQHAEKEKKDPEAISDRGA